MSNNPFAPPQPGSAEARFPPLSSPSPQPGQYQQQQQFQQPQFSQPQQAYSQPQFLSSTPSVSGFQPTSSFGQGLQPQYGQQQQQPFYGGGGMGGMTAQPTGFYSSPSPMPQAPVADLDPYSSISSWGGQAPPTTIGYQTTTVWVPSPSPSIPVNENHPKGYVQSHRQDLEKWDPYNWKQLIGKYDGLEKSWKERLDDIEKLFGWRKDAHGSSRYQDLKKDCEDKIGLISASKFQCSEVEQSYRHSSDSTSRSRVRQALNDSLKSLPEFATNVSNEESALIAEGEQIRAEEARQREIERQREEQRKAFERQQEEQRKAQEMYEKQRREVAEAQARQAYQQAYQQQAGFQQQQQQQFGMAGMGLQPQMGYATGMNGMMQSQPTGYPGMYQQQPQQQFPGQQGYGYGGGGGFGYQ
ncbi:hypothetical protein BT69DRAFT_1347740 [Atractiella rhizophila]|nr:hypothetical protein BT69DRAFT_1347740 [Atractiella rhizophila]